MTQLMSELLLEFLVPISRSALRGIEGAWGAVPRVRSTAMSFKAVVGRYYTLFWRVQIGEERKEKTDDLGHSGLPARSRDPQPFYKVGYTKYTLKCPTLPSEG